MRGDRGNKQVTQRVRPAWGAQCCGGTRGGPGGRVGKFRQRRRGSPREDALKELVGQGRGACGAGAAGLGLGAGTAERGRKSHLSSLTLPIASLQPHPQPPHPKPSTKGFPPACNSQNRPPEGSVGPAGVDRVACALPDHTLSFPGSRLIRTRHHLTMPSACSRLGVSSGPARWSRVRVLETLPLQSPRAHTEPGVCC